jgi:MFS family permease
MTLFPEARVDLLSSAPRRKLLFTLLYVSEGAPMGFIWWALPTLLKREGLDLATITTLTSAATLPWVLKFLAGPVIDASVARGVGLRRWIVICQLLMGLSLLPMAWLDWTGQFALVTALLVGHAACAATQDVAIDTLAIRAVPPEELGGVNGWMQAGMLIGRGAVSGGALALGAWLGQTGMVFALVAFLWCVPAVVLLATREPPREHAAVPPPAEWARALTGAPILLGLFVALTASTGFEFLGIAAGPLLTDFGTAPGSIALLFGVVAPVGTAAGALAGSRLVDRLGPRRATVVGILTVGALASAVASLTFQEPPLAAGAWLWALAPVYPGIGFLTTASYALFMHLARGRFAATRFSMLMAATNGCETWAGFAGGRLQVITGYGWTLILLAAFSLAAIPGLWLLGKQAENRRE